MEGTHEIYTQDGTTDMHGKPAVKKDTGRWRACPYILGIVLKELIVGQHFWKFFVLSVLYYLFISLLSPANECCERLAYYGMSTNLVNYMIDHLNLGNVEAANNVTNWSGTVYIMPLLGAFLADAYFGRYWTISSFMIIYIIVRSVLSSSFAILIMIFRNSYHLWTIYRVWHF